MQDPFSFYKDQCAVALNNLSNLLCVLTLAARTSKIVHNHGSWLVNFGNKRAVKKRTVHNFYRL
jgi:hypothetical protein